MMPISLPTRLGAPPLVEAVIELRFRPSHESVGDLLPGLLYAALKPDFQHPVALPIAGIPREVRRARPELTHLAHVKLAGTDQSLLIGDRVVTISKTPPYAGWNTYRELADRVFTSLKRTELVSGVERFSLKCINLIELKGRHPFELLNGEIRLADYRVSSEGLHLRIQTERSRFLNIVEIASEATADLATGTRTGAMLSIDTIRSVNDSEFWPNVPRAIDEAHQVLKEMFFELVREEIVGEWQPVWNSTTA